MLSYVCNWYDFEKRDLTRDWIGLEWNNKKNLKPYRRKWLQATNTKRKRNGGLGLRLWKHRNRETKTGTKKQQQELLQAHTHTHTSRVGFRYDTDSPDVKGAVPAIQAVEGFVWSAPYPVTVVGESRGELGPRALPVTFR